MAGVSGGRVLATLPTATDENKRPVRPERQTDRQTGKQTNLRRATEPSHHPSLVLTGTINSDRQEERTRDQ